MDLFWLLTWEMLLSIKNQTLSRDRRSDTLSSYYLIVHLCIYMLRRIGARRAFYVLFLAPRLNAPACQNRDCERVALIIWYTNILVFCYFPHPLEDEIFGNPISFFRSCLTLYFLTKPFFLSSVSLLFLVALVFFCGLGTIDNNDGASFFSFFSGGCDRSVVQVRGP